MATKKDPEIAKLEKRAKVAREKVKIAKIHKELGLDPPMDFTTRGFKARIRKQARELPKETRQQVLDALNDRENPQFKTYNGIAEAFGLKFNDVLGVELLNTEVVRYTFLRTETK
ncbi:MAG: hypothetical protein DELT_02545 [Desulfovibrio sp.]